MNVPFDVNVRVNVLFVAFWMSGGLPGGFDARKIALCSTLPPKMNVTEAPDVIVTRFGVNATGRVNTVSFVDTACAPTVRLVLPAMPPTDAVMDVVPVDSVDTLPA
ncbi:MAG: hypothetical protein JWM95_5452 [Gemmatimonadetes bacterium]|nr:hypothetical protein [Gemmatimonadota bacterium]